MSFISDVFAGGTEGVLKGVKDIISNFKADPLELARLEAAVAQAEGQIALGLSQAQNRVNEIEAASTDKFASRWRPAAGWAGVAGLAYALIAYPVLTWASLNFGLTAPPQIDHVILMEVVTGMLGLGAMRSWDKRSK